MMGKVSPGGPRPFLSICNRRLLHTQLMQMEWIILFPSGPCHQTELESACQAEKPIYWHQVVVKESTSFIAGTKQGERAAHAQKTLTPQWLSGKGFLGNVCGEGCSVHDFLLIGWWWGNRVVFQESPSSTFWFQPVWGFSHSYHLPPGWGVLVSVKQLKGMCQIVMYVPWGGTRTLFYFSCLTTFPLFLHSLTPCACFLEPREGLGDYKSFF